MRKLFRNKEGNVAIQAVVVMLILLLIFSVIGEYLRLQIIAKGIRDAIQASVISVATQNYDEVYNGLREGYSGGYALYDDNWEGSVDEGSVMNELTSLLGLSFGKKYTGGMVEYGLSELEVKIINTPLAPSNDDKRFESEVYVTLSVPLSFGWQHLPPMTINMKVNAGYTPKF